MTAHGEHSRAQHLPRWLLLLALGALPASCADGQPKQATAPSVLATVEGEVVARVNGEPVSRAELELMMQLSGSDEVTALRTILELHALAAEAQARGIDESVELRLAHERAMVQRLLELEVEAKVSEADVTDSIIERVYADFGLELFVPEQVTASHLLLLVGPEASAEQVEQHMAFARELRAAMKAPVSDEQLDELAFIANLRGYPAMVEPNLTFPRRPVRPLSGRESRYKSMVPAFADAAFALDEQQSLSDPVRTEYGIHLISFRQRSMGHRPPLDTVRNEIRQEVVKLRRAARTEELLGLLREKAELEVDDELLRATTSSLSLGAVK